MATILRIIAVVTAACAALVLAAAWTVQVLWAPHVPARAWIWALVAADGILLYGMLDRRAPIFGRIFGRGRADEPIIALTFDDGPNEPYTSRLLDILHRADVRATFFVIGRNVVRAPEVVARMVHEGHEVGNHTFDHVVLPLATPGRVRAQIRRASDAIAGATGARPALFRAPHGWRNPWVDRVAREEGCRPVAWTLGVWDTDRPGADVIRQRVARGLSNGCVVLLHDGRGTEASADASQLVAALPGILDDARARGFRFVTLGQLIDRASAR